MHIIFEIGDLRFEIDRVPFLFINLLTFLHYMSTFADKVIAFNKSLQFKGKLPPGIRVMNPFRENKDSLAVSSAFYKKYYSDNNRRHIILGINPGRFGAGLTGVACFTGSRKERL